MTMRLRSYWRRLYSYFPDAMTADSEVVLPVSPVASQQASPSPPLPSSQASSPREIPSQAQSCISSATSWSSRWSSYASSASSRRKPSYWTPSPPLEPRKPPPGVVFRMNRECYTIPDLWKQWHYGDERNMSVVVADLLYGNSWRVEDSERIYYWRRKKIITAIEEYAVREKITGDMAVVEAELLRELSGHSLAYLSMHPEEIYEEFDQLDRMVL